MTTKIDLQENLLSWDKEVARLSNIHSEKLYAMKLNETLQSLQEFYKVAENLDKAIAYRNGIIETLKQYEMVDRVTPEDVVGLLDRADNASVHGFLAQLWTRQTEDEKRAGGARWSNGRGYSAHDAGFAQSLLKWYAEKKFFTPKQRAAGVKMLKKYRVQLAEIANKGN